jgi:hypothetical protein
VCVERSHSPILRYPLTALVVTCACACTAPVIPIGSALDVGYVAVIDNPPVIGQDLDLLFVVDNSETMGGRQLALTHSFDKLMTHLEFAGGGVPNLHVAVVSTDMGVGDNPISGCNFAGDDGKFQGTPRLLDCPAPEDAFLRDYGDGDQRSTNFGDGDRSAAFACISTLGTDGCGFEQPLRAMRRALDGSNPANDGFLRADAVLGIVFLTDEDDCSVFDSNMFMPDEHGEVDKYRCFANGVTCSDDVRSRFTGCKSNPYSDFMPHVGDYADFVSGLKFDSDSIVVTGMMGDSSMVEVAVSVDDKPQLIPVCVEDGAPTYPAVRLQHFIDESTDRGEIAPLCGEQPLDALSETARQLRKSLGTLCLDGDLFDVDADEPGLQIDCIVYDLAPDGSRSEIPECDDPYRPFDSATTCYAIKRGPAQCGDFQPHQLALQVWRGDWDAGQPWGTHTIGECLVESPDQQ